MESKFGMIYAISMGIVILFQGCLAVGLPWGAASMGGKFPGKYPPKMRLVAVINMIILSIFIFIVLIRANILFSRFHLISIYIIWIVVLFSAMSVVLNSITKSKVERIWIPVTAIHLVSSLIVAIT